MKKKLFTLMAAAALLAACSDEVTTTPDNGKRHISFSVSSTDADGGQLGQTFSRSCFMAWPVEQTAPPDARKTTVAVETDLPVSEGICLTITDEPYIRRTSYADITRGALLNSADARSLLFGVTEFPKDSDTPLFSNTVPVAQNTTLDGGRELFKANETWEYDSYDGVEYDFFAYAPRVNGTAQGITLSNVNRTISYDPTGVEVGNQPDLMTARKVTSSYVGAIPLNFQHRLCAIQIKTTGTWTAGYHVSAVKFYNVISTGTFDVDTDKDDAWTTKGPVGDYEVTGFNQAEASGAIVTGDDKWLMMVPQTLSSAKLSITMTDGSHPYVITAPINASTWRAGHTVTYTVSPEAISTMTVNYPSGTARSWNRDGNAEQGPVTTYASTDQFGLFVLDKDNKVIISNQLVTPTTGSAAASRTLDIPTSIFKSKQYRYFLMYPYKSDADLETLVGTDNYNSYYKLNATGRATDADAFFADVVTNWTVATDQSTEATFKAQDLQIADLSGDHFDMVHKMGLLAGTLPAPIVDTDVITYDGNSYNADATDEKWTKIDSKCTTTTWNASITFTSSTDKPYKSGSVIYYIAKPGNDEIAISATSSASYYAWSVSGSETTVASANTCKTFDIVTPPEYQENDYNKKVWEFAFSGAGKSFVVPVDGIYIFECWGGAGGRKSAGSTTFSKGGYTCGTISLSANEIFYIYVGQSGINGGTKQKVTASYNGGGRGGWQNYSSTTDGGSGGGSTDIRTQRGLTSAQLSSWGTDWNNLYGRYGRIMVAAGGGGSAGYEWTVSDMGDAGGLSGYSSSRSNGSSGGMYGCTGATQTSGGVPSTTRWKGSIAYVAGNTGQFGYGGNAAVAVNPGAGGGGGYWGGAGGPGGDVGMGGVSGSGGSSYISGHAGCVAVASAGSTTPKSGTVNSVERSIHYSGLYFTNTRMVDGRGYIWTTSVSSTVTGMPIPTNIVNSTATEIGHDADGYVRITLVKNP